MFFHSDAGPFPVSVPGIAEGPACGTVLSGRCSCSCPGTLRQCLLPELRTWSTRRTGRSIPLMEGCSPGMHSWCVLGTKKHHLSCWQHPNFLTLLTNLSVLFLWGTFCELGSVLYPQKLHPNAINPLNGNKLIPRLINYTGPFLNCCYKCVWENGWSINPLSYGKQIFLP